MKYRLTVKLGWNLSLVYEGIYSDELDRIIMTISWGSSEELRKVTEYSLEIVEDKPTVEEK